MLETSSHTVSLLALKIKTTVSICSFGTEANSLYETRLWRIMVALFIRRKYSVRQDDKYNYHKSLQACPIEHPYMVIDRGTFVFLLIG